MAPAPPSRDALTLAQHVTRLLVHAVGLATTSLRVCAAAEGGDAAEPLEAAMGAVAIETTASPPKSAPALAPASAPAPAPAPAAPASGQLQDLLYELDVSCAVLEPRTLLPAPCHPYFRTS